MDRSPAEMALDNAARWEERELREPFDGPFKRRAREEKEKWLNVAAQYEQDAHP